jgi:hypothetical protein
MRIIVINLILMLLILSCQDEVPIGIDSSGQVKLDNIGASSDGWGIGALVISHDGSKIYYAVINVQTLRHELRMIDAHSNVTKIFSGAGQIDALDISKDDNTLLYSMSAGYGSESKLYEYPLDSRIAKKLLSVTGDGYFWQVQYLPNGNIIDNQAHGGIGLSLRRLDRISKEVIILLDKSENPILVDIDEVGERLLVEGWTSSRIMTLNFDGTELKDFGKQTPLTRPVCFSPDGSEILADQQGDPQAAQGSAESFLHAVSFDTQTGQKNILTHAEENTWPVAYGKDKNELILSIGNQFPGELSLFDRSLNTYDRITNNQLSENFLGFYANSAHRILFEGEDPAGNSGLYILNK